MRDKKGKPVYDLRKEEIELYVNKKPYKILDFMSYQVTENAEKKGDLKKADKKEEQVQTVISKAGEEQGKREITIKSPERVNFIILDGISTTKNGIRNAKKLAMESFEKRFLIDALRFHDGNISKAAEAVGSMF